MPSKRYIFAFGIIAVFSALNVWQFISHKLLPTESDKRLQYILSTQGNQPALNAFEYSSILLYAAIVILFTRRLYFFAIKKEQPFETDASNNLYKIHKTGILFINMGYAIIVLSIIGTALIILFAKPGEASGVPVGIVAILSVFLFFLSVFCIEIGNFTARRKKT